MLKEIYNTNMINNIPCGTFKQWEGNGGYSCSHFILCAFMQLCSIERKTKCFMISDSQAVSLWRARGKAHYLIN